jgi:hypothetical protein
MVLRAGSGSEFIEAYPEDPSFTFFFSSKTRNKELPFVCSTEDKILNKELTNKISKTAADNKVLRRFAFGLVVQENIRTYHRSD